MRLAELVSHLDHMLDVEGVPDYPNALNGLQVENSGAVERVAVAVDASLASIDAAAAAGCSLLVVHHGMFWDGNRPVIGRRHARLRSLFDHDIALYSAHLPLDVHAEMGNNALLSRAIGVDPRGHFGSFQGFPIGTWGDLDISREALCARLDELLGVRVRMIPGGPERIRRVGVVTGSAADLTGEAIAVGLDAFITGEGAHHTFFDAMEGPAGGGINVYHAGHYATETFGVRALGAHLESEFGLPWHFIDQPTGL